MRVAEHKNTVGPTKLNTPEPTPTDVIESAPPEEEPWIAFDAIYSCGTENGVGGKTTTFRTFYEDGVAIDVVTTAV